jgi:group I intron endonuclease
MIFDVALEDYRKIGVYCITNNINNKIYIGSTTTSFRHRYLQYVSSFKRKLHNQPVLHRAFIKHGFENFTFSIKCICLKEDCIKTEQTYINAGVDYNSCLVAGSLEGFKHSSDSKTKTIIKGEHHSAKKVDMYSIEGVFIKTFDSILEATEENKVKSKSNIIQCCKGKVYSAGGYRWTYHNEPLVNRNKREGGKIKIFLTKGEFYQEFNSQVEAADYIKSLNFKCNQARIQRASKSNEKVYGFTIKIIKIKTFKPIKRLE